jgi:hypothetical protein
MKNIYGRIPTEPIELNFEFDDNIEEQLKLRETEDLHLLLDELSTI